MPPAFYHSHQSLLSTLQFPIRFCLREICAPERFLRVGFCSYRNHRKHLLLRAAASAAWQSPITQLEVASTCETTRSRKDCQVSFTHPRTTYTIFNSACVARLTTIASRKLAKVPIMMYSACLRFSLSFNSPKRKMDFAATRKPTPAN